LAGEVGTLDVCSTIGCLHFLQPAAGITVQFGNRWLQCLSEQVALLQDPSTFTIHGHTFKAAIWISFDVLLIAFKQSITSTMTHQRFSGLMVMETSMH